ncbi:uncharacterized protein LTR77_004971 [Saxophila tyrrhenica]|uniref:BTB domain-containing protein n=1 Tax=Saxophila tyrrhenica TaxID=1690608 RepID=A0AAV9PAK4_9PEZI|nr:hypothetical protein LTR77_004971 [Saxophila tyrrhenica]
MATTKGAVTGASALSIRGRMDEARCGNESIKVVIGEGDTAQTLYIHTSLLEKHSDFFVVALREEWKEGQERMVELKNANFETFTIFKNFLYEGRILSSKEETRREGSADGSKTHDKEWARISRC